jgi:hypothetical protein
MPDYIPGKIGWTKVGDCEIGIQMIHAPINHIVTRRPRTVQTIVVSLSVRRRVPMDKRNGMFATDFKLSSNARMNFSLMKQSKV